MILKNTAHKNLVAYLIKRGALHKHVGNFYIFYSQIFVVLVTTSLTWKMKKYGCCHGTCYTL